MEENRIQSEQIDQDMSKQYSERLKIASRIALRWVNALNLASEQEPNNQDMSSLADKIMAMMALSVEGNQDSILKLSIEELGPSVRLYNALKRAGINTVEDLLPLNYEKIRKMRYMGDSCVNELKAKLGAIGITLPEK